MDIRNIAIIAHVDHGKTTLTDALLRQNGAVSDASASMDSNTLEKERGITIYAKNTALFYKDTKINIVDTPGHADFGSEVERVLRSIDCVLLIVDAQEGPMPQTRFVLKKSLELGLKPIVVINKIDKPAANPALCEEQVFDLFVELGASDEQAEFPVIYAIGRQGIAKKNLADDSTNLNPLLDEVLKHVPAAPQSDASVPLRLQTFNLAYDNFLGRMAVGRVYDGVLNTASTVVITNNEGVTRKGKITKMFTFKGFERVEAETVGAGDIVMIAGIPDITIGETVSDRDGAVPLPPIHVDEPTISLNFLVNNSPFAGKDGKFVTSRQIRDRLERELEINVGLKVVFTSPDAFEVSGRGELHIAILLEQMRREGFEMQVSQPRVITREENGQKVEPFEEVTIDTPNEYQGAIIERLGMRGFMLTNMVMKDTTTRITLEGPTRGLLGYRGQFVIDTKGEGILSSQVIGFKHFTGTIQKRVVGSMISMMSGTSISFALWNLQDRGLLYIGPQVEVYEGMVIGNTSKGEEMVVNPIKGKQLTNMRASGTDEAVKLTPPFTITIERGLEIMNDDEYLEITPNFTRIRKQGLTENDRNKSKR